MPALHLQGHCSVGVMPFSMHPSEPAYTGKSCSDLSQLKTQSFAIFMTKLFLAIGPRDAIQAGIEFDASTSNKHYSTSAVSRSIKAEDI